MIVLRGDDGDDAGRLRHLAQRCAQGTVCRANVEGCCTAGLAVDFVSNERREVEGEGNLQSGGCACVSGSSTPGEVSWYACGQKVLTGSWQVCASRSLGSQVEFGITVAHAQQTTHSCPLTTVGRTHARTPTPPRHSHRHTLSPAIASRIPAVASNARSRDQLLCYPLCSLSLQATHMHRLLSRGPGLTNKVTNTRGVPRSTTSADPAPRRSRCVRETVAVRPGLERMVGRL